MKIFSLIHFAFVALCFTSCFSLREPVPPANASDWTPPNQPEVLISNFATAVATYNLVNYDRCFIKEGFHFQADPTVAANNQGLFQNWSYQNNELEYFRNLQRVQDKGQPSRLTFLTPRTNFINADSVEYIATYEMYLYLQDTVFASPQFKGNITLSLSRNTFNEWVIGAWRDNKTDPAIACWTELKEKYASR